MNNSFFYTTGIHFIILLKIIYVTLAIGKIVYSNNTRLSENINYWKDRTEIVFVSSMAVLLIYLFYPREKSIYIDNETRFLLYMFGIVLLLTADWAKFIGESKGIRIFQSIFGSRSS